MSESPVVLVTGGAKRIGAAIVRRFHEQGFRVIVHVNRSVTEANALVAELNSIRRDSAKTLQADLTDSAQVERLATECLECFERLDVLVNNASSFYPTPFPEARASHWDELIDSNLRSAYFLSQALVSELHARGGSIVNIIDAMVEKTVMHHSIYNIAKAGLKAMTKSLARELGPSVRVNGVAPGAILWPEQLEDSSDPVVLQKRAKALEQIPLGELGTAEDIAQAVYFLACEASYMTGETLKVDGGRSL